MGGSIPLSLLLTLALMDILNFSLNVVTAIALVIAIGMVVDSSIVVIESCFRSGEALADPGQAARSGAKTVSAAITASTITTIVVYLPILLMNQMAAQMYAEFGWIIVITLLGSLTAALTMVPLCYCLLRPREHKELPVSRWLRRFNLWYDKLMRVLLPKRVLVLLVSIGLLLGSGALLLTMHVELIPNVDEGDMSISCEFRSGTKLEVMDEQIAFIEQMIREDENFDTYSLSITGAASANVMGGAANTAAFTVYRAEEGQRSSAESVELYSAALSEVTGMNITVDAYSSLSYLSAMMDSTTVTLEGTDMDELRQATLAVEEAISGVPGLLHTSSDAAAAATAVKIDVDSLLAMNLGLTPAQVAGEIYYTLSGYQAASVTASGEEYDIRLEYPEGSYADLNALLDKRIATPYNTTVALSDIAVVEYESESPIRSRVDGRYQMTVSAIAQKDFRLEASKRINEVAASLELPPSVKIVASAMEDMTNEELGQMARAIFIAMFLVLLVMAMQFESVRFSLLVMVCVPFSLIGSFVALRLGGSTLSMVSLMGFMMMVGIVVNNGILLVDTVNQLRRAGMPLEEALIASGQIRLRPILMTTLTTVLAMAPLLFATGMAEMLRGIAQVVIGGLLASTLLIVVLMTTFYLMIMGKKNRQAAAKEADAQRLAEITGKSELV